MLFTHKLSANPIGVRAGNVSTLVPARPIITETASPPLDSTKEKQLPRKKSFLSHFLSFPKSKLEAFKRLIRALIIAIPTVGTLPLIVGINEGFARLGFVPQPTNTQKNNLSTNIDSIITNTNIPNSGKITEAISKAGIDLESLDSNKSKRVPDTTVEFEALIAQLQQKQSITPPGSSDNALYAEAIDLLTTLKELNKYVWGENGIDSKKIFQIADECAILANVIGATLTEENAHDLLKTSLRITRFDLSKKEPEIDFEVTIGGKKIQVPNEALKKYSQYYHFQGSVRGPDAITYALTKELEKNYISDSFRPLSSPSTLLTNKQYYTIPIALLSNEALEQILKATPKKIITIGTFYPNVQRYLSLGSSSPQPSVKKYPLSKSRLLLDHAYVVKGWKEDNGKIKYILMDGGSELSLTQEEIENDVLWVSVPAAEISPHVFGQKTILMWMVSILAAIALTKGVNSIERKRALKQESTISSP
ncbi:MAG: hypothetical protein HY094_07170 [Candidatus Melainabacteria bacterium]|nr:hypothetical protein [Candidatus Melainabacteria bacterium]